VDSGRPSDVAGSPNPEVRGPHPRFPKCRNEYGGWPPRSRSGVRQTALRKLEEVWSRDLSGYDPDGPLPEVAPLVGEHRGDGPSRQRRMYRTEYPGTTLRDNLGLPAVV
jgi:hypothetical protein